MEQKRTLPARQIVSEIKSGATDDEIMLKYNLTAEDLKVFFGKLLQAGLITQADLEQRPTRFEDKFDLDFEDGGPVNNSVSVPESTSDTPGAEDLVESSQSQTTPYIEVQGKESETTSEGSDDVRKQVVESSSKPTGDYTTESSSTDTKTLREKSLSKDDKKTIFLLIILTPLGLYRLWKTSGFKQKTKIIITVVAVIVGIILFPILLTLWVFVVAVYAIYCLYQTTRLNKFIKVAVGCIGLVLLVVVLNGMNQKQGPSLTPEGIEKSPKGEDKKLEMSQESKQIRTPSVPEKPQSSQQISKEDEWVINEGLFRAVDSNDIEAVKLFLDKGAKINAKSSKGDYILMQAYKPEMVRLLLDKGANVNAKTSNGWTVLMSACSRGSKKEHIEIVRLLLDKGADVNAKSTTRGTTPLMLACDGGGPIEVIKLLLDRGAKANAKDNFGNSALGKAGGRPEVLDLLKAHGVKE